MAQVTSGSRPFSVTVERGASVSKADARVSELIGSFKDDVEGSAYLNAGTTLIREGVVLKHNRAGTSSRVHFILTGKVLLMAEEVTSMSVDLSFTVAKSMKLRHAFPLTEVRLSPRGRAGERVLVESLIKTFEVTPSPPVSVDEWCKAVTGASLAALKSAGLPAGHLSTLKFSPSWESNQPSCGDCGRDFTLLVRRHHCRSCGKCCCGACCFEKVRMDEVDGGAALHLVCNNCAAEIKQKRRGNYGGGSGV